MNTHKFFKLSLGAVFALPITLLFGSELFANNLSDNYQLQVSQEKLLACGGGGGSSPAARKEKAQKQAKAKLGFWNRKLKQQTAAGEDTTETLKKINLYQQLIDEKADGVY